MTAAIGPSSTSSIPASTEQTNAKSVVKEEKISLSTLPTIKNKTTVPFSLGKLAAQDAQSQARVHAIRKLWLENADCGYLD